MLAGRYILYIVFHTFLCSFTDNLIFLFNMFNFCEIHYLAEICSDTTNGEE
jgi:hypothetical protein